MQTIAEFVHSKEVYDKLLQLDIDYMQGYYIAEPKPNLLTSEELFQ
jgi:EAL domain-containing protein (putative c-di-GMP-specific phosphodiesterase class I)